MSDSDSDGSDVAFDVGRVRRRGGTDLHVLLAQRAPASEIMKLLAEQPLLAQVPDDYETLPLHTACRTRAAGRVIKQLVELYPDAAGSTGEDELPLHAALEAAKNAGDEEWLNGLLALITACPAAAATPGEFGRLPIHMAAAIEGAPAALLSALVEAYPAGSTTPSGFDESTPLHSLLRQKHIDLEAFALLLSAAPAAAGMKDDDGDYPLHTAAKTGAPLPVVEMVMSAYPEAVSAPGDGGCLPLHFALRRPPAQRPAGVVDFLQAANPSALSKAADAGPAAKPGAMHVRGELPLHAALRMLSSCNAAQMAAETDKVIRLVQAEPAAAAQRTSEGWFPLAIAALARAPLRLIAALYEAHPPAVRERGNFAVGTPLHLALSPSAGTIDVPVALFLLERHSSVASEPDTLSAAYMLPLHLACASAGGKGSDDGQEAALLQALLALNPAAAGQRCGIEARSPLHWLVASGARPASFGVVLEAFPAAAALADGHGKLPLHLLVASPLATPLVVSMLVAAHPSAASATDEQGALPLHRCAAAVASDDASKAADAAMRTWLEEDDRLLEQLADAPLGSTTHGTAAAGAGAGAGAEAGAGAASAAAASSGADSVAAAAAAAADALRRRLPPDEIHALRQAAYTRHIAALPIVQVLDVLIDADPESIKTAGAGSTYDSTAPTGLTALHIAMGNGGSHAVVALHLLRRWPDAALVRAPSGDLPVHGLARCWKSMLQAHHATCALQKEGLLLPALLRMPVAALSLFVPAVERLTLALNANVRLPSLLEPLAAQDVHRFLTPHWSTIITPRLLQALQLWANLSQTSGAASGVEQEQLDNSALQAIPWFAPLCSTAEPQHQRLAAACIDALPSVKHVRAAAALKDDGGRSALDASPAPLRAVFERRLLLFGCFDVDTGAPAHISETCIVRLATVKAPLRLPGAGDEPPSTALPAASAAPAATPPTSTTMAPAAGAAAHPVDGSRPPAPSLAGAPSSASSTSSTAPGLPLPQFKVGDRVALKFMRHREHYDRERAVRARVHLDARYVMPLLACFCDADAAAVASAAAESGAGAGAGAASIAITGAAVSVASGEGIAAASASSTPPSDADVPELCPPSFAEEAGAHGIPHGYGFCLALPAASRTLSDIMTHELLAGRDWPRLRDMAKQLGEALHHIHSAGPGSSSAGLVHGDVKPLNIMFHGASGRFLLIDLDGAAAVGAAVGSKHSAAYLPPERLAAVYGFPYRYTVGVDRGDAAGAIAVAEDGSTGVLAVSAAAAASSSDPGPALDGEVLSLRSGRVAHPSQDMWSLGMVLFEAFAGRPLLAAGADGSADEAALRSVAAWSVEGDVDAVRGSTPAVTSAGSGLLLHQQLQAISDPLARNLVAWLLHPRPEHRPSAERFLEHEFVSGRPLARLPGQPPRWDVFLSYRVAADAQHVQRLYERLTAAGLRVFWDQKCLLNGKAWEEGFVRGLASSTLLVPVLSPQAVANFLTLTADSWCDNVLLEYRLGLELLRLGWLSSIYPVLLNDTAPLEAAAPGAAVAVGGAGIVPAAALASASLGFVGQWFPPTRSLPTCSVVAVEAKVRQHLSSLCLGSPLLPESSTTVRATMSSLMAFQAFLLDKPAPPSTASAQPSPAPLQPVGAALDAAAVGIMRALKDASRDVNSSPLKDSHLHSHPDSEVQVAADGGGAAAAAAVHPAHPRAATLQAARSPIALSAHASVATASSGADFMPTGDAEGIIGALVQLARQTSAASSERTATSRTASGGAGCAGSADYDVSAAPRGSPTDASPFTPSTTTALSFTATTTNTATSAATAPIPTLVARSCSAATASGSAGAASARSFTVEPEQLAARLADMLTDDEVLGLQRLIDAAAAAALHMKRARSLGSVP